MVKQYAYCPMILWITRYLDYRGEPTPRMEAGRAKAIPEFKMEIARRLGLPKPYRAEYMVEYGLIRLSDVVDLIAGEKRLTVLEVKVYRRNKEWLNRLKVQLLTYAYIVEKTIGPIQEAVLYNGGDVERIRPTQSHYNWIERIVNSLSRLLGEETPPLTRQNPRKCGYCEYRRLCPNYY